MIFLLSQQEKEKTNSQHEVVVLVTVVTSHQRLVPRLYRSHVLNCFESANIPLAHTPNGEAQDRKPMRCPRTFFKTCDACMAVACTCRQDTKDQILWVVRCVEEPWAARVSAFRLHT